MLKKVLLLSISLGTISNSISMDSIIMDNIQEYKGSASIGAFGISYLLIDRTTNFSFMGKIFGSAVVSGATYLFLNSMERSDNASNIGGEGLQENNFDNPVGSGRIGEEVIPENNFENPVDSSEIGEEEAIQENNFGNQGGQMNIQNNNEDPVCRQLMGIIQQDSLTTQCIATASELIRNISNINTLNNLIGFMANNEMQDILDQRIRELSLRNINNQNNVNNQNSNISINQLIGLIQGNYGDNDIIEGINKYQGDISASGVIDDNGSFSDMTPIKMALIYRKSKAVIDAIRSKMGVPAINIDTEINQAISSKNQEQLNYYRRDLGYCIPIQSFEPEYVSPEELINQRRNDLLVAVSGNDINRLNSLIGLTNDDFEGCLTDDCGDNNLLHIAIEGCKDEERCKQVLDWLIGNGLDINSAGNCSYTPLHIAVKNRKFEVAKFLVGRDANKSLQDGLRGIPYDFLIKTEKGKSEFAFLKP